MSFEIRLPIQRSELPSSAQWNEAIREAGFALVLDEFDWATGGGFLPARLLNCASGFELWCDPADGDVLELAPGSDSVVSARLGGYWFELVCAMCSLAVLQGGTELPLIDDWEQHSPQQAMAGARQLYNQSRIVIEHLHRLDARLEWNEPPLGHLETQETRHAALGALVSDGTLIRETSPLGERFRMHKLKRQELAEQLQMNTPGTAS